MIPTAEEFRYLVEEQLDIEAQFRMEYERVERQIYEAIRNRDRLFDIKISKFSEGIKKVLEDKGYKVTKTATSNVWLISVNERSGDLVNIEHIEGGKI